LQKYLFFFFFFVFLGFEQVISCVSIVNSSCLGDGHLILALQAIEKVIVSSTCLVFGFFGLEQVILWLSIENSSLFRSQFR